MYKDKIVITNGLVFKEGAFLPLNVYIAGGKIEKFSSWAESDRSYDNVDAAGKKLVPGFIDIHIHGRNNLDLMDVVKDKTVIAKLASEILKTGVTSFLPTALTSDFETYLAVIRKMADYIDNQSSELPQAIGVYSEGVFFNIKRAGAQSPEFLKNPSRDLVEKVWDASNGKLKILALAPELEGAEEAIRFITEKGVIASMAHSWAEYEDAVRAYNAGLRGATHFMDAMKPMTHLEPSLVGAGMLYDDITIEIIGDGMHVRPEVVKLLFRIKPIESIILVTDNVWVSGTAPGEYYLGTVPIINEGHRLVAKETEYFSLAGSCITLDTTLRNVVEYSSKPLEDVLKCITENPARYLGAADHIGFLKEGYDANINILGEGLKVEKTFIKGHIHDHR